MKLNAQCTVFRHHLRKKPAAFSELVTVTGQSPRFQVRTYLTTIFLRGAKKKSVQFFVCDRYLNKVHSNEIILRKGYSEKNGNSYSIITD